MLQKLTMTCCLILVLPSVASAFCQSNATPPAESKPTVRFVDTEDKEVIPESALFYNGGRAKPIPIDRGVGRLPEAKGVVVAKAKGFQYSGTVVDGSENQVVFYRDDQARDAAPHTAFPLTSEIKDSVRETIKEYVLTKIEGQPPASMSTVQSVRTLAAVDPKAALDWLDDNNLPNQLGMMIRQPILISMLQSDVEEAFDQVSQIEDATMRTMVLGNFLKELAKDDPALAVVETQFVETSRTIKQPTLRFGLQATLAEHYMATGRKPLADRIVDQHIQEIKKLPSDGLPAYTRSLFAALVADRNSDLARELIAGITDHDEATRAQARVAFACCRSNPDMAIELLSLYQPAENTITVWNNHIKVAHRMAVEQPEAAIELASLIDEPNQQAWAYGLMAMRVHDSDPKSAKLLLERAIETLSAPHAKNQKWFPVGSTLVGLLPVIEKVDPSKMTSVIWQSIFETLPRSRWVVGTSNKIKIQSLAGAIARNDLELGRALLSQKVLEPHNIFAEAAARQALLYPSELVAYSEKLAATASIREARIFEKFTDLLTMDENEFWNSISKPGMLDWPSDRFENF